MGSPFFLLLSCSSLVVAGLRPVIFSFFSVASAFSVTSVWISYFLLLRFRRRSTNLFPLLTPPEHCFSHSLHRPLRHGSRLIRTGVENFQNTLCVPTPAARALPLRTVYASHTPDTRPDFPGPSASSAPGPSPSLSFLRECPRRFRST